MRIPHRVVIGVLAAAAALAAPAGASAQASLASEHTINEIKVKVGGVDETFTVMRDASQSAQWYYVPDRPRLFERRMANGIEPEFTLLRYQRPDPADPQRLIQGGILQFAATLALPPEAVEQLRAEIARRKGGSAGDIRLAALPFKSAEVAIYSPGGTDPSSKMLVTGVQGTGIAPVFATQKMVFSLTLTDIGADALDRLVQVNTGLPVAVIFTYNGLTPPAGFEVNVDWDQTYSHYSRDEKFRASASYFGLFGASYESQAQSIYNTLVENKCLTIKLTTGESVTSKQLQEHLAPILKRINDEMLERFRPPAEVAAAQASAPTAKGFFGSAGYSSAMKRAENVKRGSERIVYTQQDLVERKTIAAGFIGIGAYPQSVRDALVTSVPAESVFRSAYFVLPSTANAEELGIREITLEMALRADGTDRSVQSVQWTADRGWRDVRNNARSAMVFPLLGLPAQVPIKFRSKLTVLTRQDRLVHESLADATSGDVRIGGLDRSSLDVVQIDASGLSFRQMDPASDLTQVGVTLTSGGRTLTSTLVPRLVSGQRQAPEPIMWLVPRGADGASPEVKAEITFHLRTGERRVWRHSGQNLQAALQSLYVYLDDEDWRRTEK